MDEKQLQFLYNEYAKGKGFKDYSEFKGLMSYEGSRKLFFDDANTELGFKDYNEFNDLLGLKKKVGGEVFSPTELPSVSREYLDKGQELADASFLKKIGEPDRSQLVSQYKSPDISLTQKPKKDYYSTKLEKGLIFDKEGQLYAPSSEALSKDITAAEQASLKKSTQKDLVEKSREMPVVAEPTEPTEEQGLLLNLVSSLDRGFAKNFISNPMKGLGTFLQGTTKKVLGGSGEGDLSNALIKYGDYLNNAIEELTPQDQEYKDSLWDQAAQALGQVGSLVLTGGLTGAAGKGAALVAQAPKGAVATAASRIASQLSAPTSISAGLSMGQAEFDRAKQAGATDDQAFEAFYKNAVTGSVLETIPVMQFFKRFNKATAGGFVNYLKTKGVAGFTGGVEEMTTEILQQLYANKTAKDIYNINQSILDGVGSSGGIGFGVGFLLNAMGANARILRKQGKTQDAIAIENQIEQYEDNLKNPKVTSGNTAKDIVTQGVEIGTQKAVQDLDRDLANNVITPEKYQEEIAFAEKAAQVADKIPETVTGESRVKSVELLVERNDIKQANQNLLQQKQASDEAYHAGIDEEIKANEERIKKIDSEVYNIAKKPSKDFGGKKYILNGEEVSQAEFEALQGKPIGTKEIITAEVKPKEGKVTEEIKPTEEVLTKRQLDNRERSRIEDVVDRVEQGDIKASNISVADKDLTEYFIDKGLDGREAYVVKDTIERLVKPLQRITDKMDTQEVKFFTENVEDITSVVEGLESARATLFLRNKDIVDNVNKEAKRLLDYYSDKNNLPENKLDNENTFAATVDLLKKFLNGDINYLDLTKFGIEKKLKDYYKPKVKAEVKPTEVLPDGIEEKNGELKGNLKDKIFIDTKNLKPLNEDEEMIAWDNKNKSKKDNNWTDKQWAESILDVPTEKDPINATLKSNGDILVTDGHHRLLAAKILGKDLSVNLKVEGYVNEKGKPNISEYLSELSSRKPTKEAKPTEVKEDVKVEVVKPEVKKSKLEAYKAKYAPKPKEKIEPIKIEDNGKPIIAKDPAENDIAIAKLAKQDNPVEEPSIKAIEGKAEGDIKAKLNEVIAEVDDKIKLATRIEMVAMNDLKTDEASFQNREGLNLKKVDDIVANYNPSEFDPIIYWTDASGQKYTLNHHRFAAAQKLKLDEIPAQKLTYPLGHPKEFQVVPATDKAEAIDFAINRSNANRSMETAVERAKALRKLQKTGTKEEVNKFLEREGKNKTKIQNIAALNENGKTIDALKMFGDAEDVQLQKETEQRSDWIGEARRRISGLTNEHENEMFDFLMDKDASKRITSKADFISKVTSLAGGFDFNPENPLNLKRFKYQTEGERAYDEVTGQLKSEIDTRQTKIDDLKARFSDPSRKDYIPTDSRDYEQTKKIADNQISKLNTEIKSFQQKLQEHYKEKGKYQGGIEQGGLFATKQITTEEISDMADIVKEFYDEGVIKLDDIKKEIAKELGYNSKALKDAVEQAYNKMVMEYTPVEISKGVIGKVGEKLNELGEEGVVMLEDDQSIFAKAAQLEQEGGKIDYDLKEANEQAKEIELEKDKNGNLIAPNGKKSNLNEVQWKLVRTPAFKNWAGEKWESILKDDNGEPRVVYHGTFSPNPKYGQQDFYTFSRKWSETNDTGFHFGTKEAAEARIADLTELSKKGYLFARDTERPRMLPVFLKTGNVLRLPEDDRLPDWRGYRIVQKIFDGIENGTLDKSAEKAFEKDIDKFYDDKLLKSYPENKPEKENKWIGDYLKKKGYDAIEYSNVVEDKGKDSYIVFRPEQVKLADGSNTTFGESGDIRFQIEAGFRGANDMLVAYRYDTDQVARERFDIPKLKKIGEGSDRVVFDLKDGKVLKVAKTPRGLEQNIYEGDYYLSGTILPETFERGLNYVVVEKISPAITRTIDLGIADINIESDKKGIGKLNDLLKKLKQFTQKDFDNNDGNLQDILAEYDLTDIMNYDVIWNDFTAKRNWGLKDGEPLHLDGGTFGGIQMLDRFKGKKPLSDSEFRDIYNKSKKAKIENKDVDKFTKFMAKPSGDILGFTYGKTIYLNASKINPNTPIHEGGHIWTKWVKKNNSKVYDRGMELVKNSKYLERAKSSKFYQEQAAKLPQAEREAYFQEEALAMAIGDKGAQFVAEAKKSSFKEWLDNLWNAIKNAAGFDNITAKELQNLTFDEFAKRAARDILSPKSEQLKPTQDAIQEQSAKEKVPRAISAGENITEGGEGVRPSKQRAKITAESKGDEEAVRMRSLYKQVITRSKGLTEEQKSILKNDPNALYTVLPIAESKRIALELIQEMGVAEAVAEASSSTTTLQPVERTMILGAAMDYYAKLGKEKLKDGDMPSAQTAARKEIDANEELRKVASTLGELGTAYGRAINAFKEIYKLSSLALERKLVKDVEELNEEREEGATEDAKQIKKIITEDASDIEDVADELTNEEVESKLDAAKKVSDLEKQVEDLRKQILERDKAQKGTKKNPLRIKRITNDTEYDKRLKDFKQRARSIVSKDDLVDLTYFGLYHIENGVTKFADWYKEMSKNFKGFRSQFKNIYNSVAEKAAENGADRNMFDNDETIQSVLDDFQQETDAKKIVQATKKVAQAKLKREEENNPERAVKIAPSLAAERIRKDAEKNLDMPSTEVEQTYLKRLVKVINNKAKEYYAEKKENISNVNDVLAFAIANGKKDFAIWERTQTELEEQIDEDEKLTEDEKEEVKDFLQAYRESIFETLLTKNQISEAVREKLIENGYFVERIVKGKPVKSVDWAKITGNASTLKEAKEKIVKSITDLGFTEAQAKGEINAILDYFDTKISEKKTAEINKYLQKGILNKVKALGKKKVKRNSVDKLVELNKKGLLDDAKIKEILAAELGLMEITNDDLKNLRDWSSKVDDENTPIFIKKEFEEKIQYLFDTKSGNINYLENRAASMSNRLSSVVNQVINLTGFLRAPSTLITVAATTGKPIVAARVFLKELVNAAQEAKTIMKGRVSRGSSFDDLIGTASGQPRVRYLEQGKGKFLGGKALGKPIYVQIGGNKVDLNPINFGYSKIKYISRLLESADTMASGAISGLTQFRIATKEINKYYPELSAAQRSQKVYDILYSVDRATELPKAIKDLKNAGVTNPTEAEINRTINERVERARSERLANDFYNQAKSLNLISEIKLKADGIANPTEDEILAQSYKTLGSTQAADLVARGERQAARETGKMTTRGITSIILLPVDMIQKSLNSGLKSKSKAVTTLSEIGDVSFSVLMPFANSIARWAEMSGELFAPYGIAKGAAYKIGSKFTSKESKISAEEYSDLGDDYLIRGTQGLAMTLAIMYAVGMLNKAEDDEQEELGKSFTGTAKEKQYALEKVQSVGKPKQSVNILGTNVSLAFLGNQGLAIGMYADFLKLRSKRKLDENMTERGELFISGLAAMEAFGGYMFDATYLSTAKKYGSAASSLIEMKEEGYMPTLGRLAGGIISSQIPFNRLQVEAATLFNPKSQSSKDFGSNLLAQMSITRAFQSGKPNFDYRGREYDYGDIYANSADGIVKMFGKAKYGDEIDAFLSEINFAATDAYRETRDEDNYKFSITNPDYTHRFMTNEEYYEFKKKTAFEFNKKITGKYEEIIRTIDRLSNPERYDLNGIKKKIVSDLLSEAKEDAFEEIQNSIFKPSKSKLFKAENRKKAISDKVSNIAAKFKKK